MLHTTDKQDPRIGSEVTIDEYLASTGFTVIWVSRMSTDPSPKECLSQVTHCHNIHISIDDMHSFKTMLVAFSAGVGASGANICIVSGRSCVN